ncbi:MAG: ferrous iron transporter B [candidate division WOR-3 bacterium]|nr:ferrous iron transporter B [candidate division WOR-3 bacterium]
MTTVLLVGNPNVGKSVIFSRLTGIKVIAANYPGTTVSFTKGRMKLNGEEAILIDVPGCYTLEPTCKAEEVACAMLQSGDIIINVVDATNLERHLFLTLQLLALKKPMIIALNFWDETKHRGIKIDVKKLEEILDVPIVPTSALRGEGLNELKAKIKQARVSQTLSVPQKEPWQQIGLIIKATQTITHRHHTLMERCGEVLIHPFWGIIFGAGFLYLSFRIVRILGECLINYLLDPFFNKLYTPLLLKLSAILKPDSFIHKILIGNLKDGELDLKEALGLLTTGVYVELGMILPYIIVFYFVLGILEDIGYLPRLAVLADGIMHRLGLHGYSIIPLFLGLGCNVPGLLATRILESRKERFIAITLISIAVPCASLQAMIIGLLAPYGNKYIGIVYLSLFLVLILSGLVLNFLLPGFSSDLVIEIPRYRLPVLSMLFRKLWFRVYSFVVDAVPFVFLGILAVNLIYIFDLFKYLIPFTRPVIKSIWGLPEISIVPIIMGFIRKDIAVALLVPLKLSHKQLLIATTVLAMFFPCIATYVMMIKDMLKAVGFMLCTSIIVGGVLNLIL